MCAFRTIYPGWYSSRAVHIHLRAHLGSRVATTQLYFPEPITDAVFSVAPYAGRPQRDTTNETRPPATPRSFASRSLTKRPEMASGAEVKAAVEAHVAAVGAADADALARLYARAARLQDPAGTTVAVGRSAIRRYFAEVLTEPRTMEIAFLAVTDHRAAVHFCATPTGGAARDVIDTMTFDEQAAITSMQAYAAEFVRLYRRGIAASAPRRARAAARGTQKAPHRTAACTRARSTADRRSPRGRRSRRRSSR
jgi:steroid delta-isomerase